VKLVTKKGMATGKMINKFTDLFDNDWKRTRSSLRARTADDRSYDPSYSWDARSDNPVSFSRLHATDMPVQPTRPITLSSKQVLSLDPTSGQFINPKVEPKQVSFIPLTADQKVLDMKTDLSGSVPILKEAAQTQKRVLVEERSAFKNNHMKAPTFRTEEVPAFMLAAGPMADQCLLNPAQRREIIEFEKRQNEAHQFIRAATAAREKTRKQIYGQQFRRGILMMDDAHNEESEIYGQRARKEHAEKQYKAQIHLERKSYLATRMSSMATNGNILVPDSIAPRVKIESMYQSKGGTAHAFSFEETHNRLFCRQEQATGSNRTQKIRDAELSGKQYNLVNLTTIEHWPSRHFPRQQDTRMAHPSQTSLEGPRNLQGSLRAF